MHSSPHSPYNNHSPSHSNNNNILITSFNQSFHNNNNKPFKQFSKLIIQSIQNLNKFTDNLDTKVTTILKLHEKQFVQSYKTHMNNLKIQLNKMKKQLTKYQEKIEYYENQGILSKYIKKNNKLQTQQNKLLTELNNKDKKIKDLKLQLQIYKNQLKFSDSKIKQIYKERIFLKEKGKDENKDKYLNNQTIIRQDQLQQQSLKILTHRQSSAINRLKYLYSHNNINKRNLQSIQTFSTQLPQKDYINDRNDKYLKLKQQEIENKIKMNIHKSHENLKIPMLKGNKNQDQNQINNNLILKERINILQNQLNSLKTQNKKLLTYNSKYASNLSQLGQFFLKCVQQLKKTISNKKNININKVTFEDFKKQDKISLISTIILNQNAMILLYDKIFKPQLKEYKKINLKNNNQSRAHSVLARSFGKNQYKNLHSQRTQIMDDPENNIQIIDRAVFPKIKNHRVLY